MFTNTITRAITSTDTVSFSTDAVSDTNWDTVANASGTDAVSIITTDAFSYSDPGLISSLTWLKNCLYLHYLYLH